MTKRRRGGVFLILVPSLLLLTGLVLERAESLFALRICIQRTPASFDSSLAVDAQEVSNGLPLLSVYADHERLFDPSDGLVTNPRRSGRRSEAPAAVSYFDRGRLALPSVSVCTVGIA